MGKRKIEIEKITNRHKRSVTFTKRRDGLFKKAETACLKFGLQIGIVAFSPAGKPFTFCNSSSVSLDAIIDTYMMSSSSSSSAVVMGKRSRSDEDDDVQVIETEKKKKKRKIVMNDAVVTPPPPCITVQEEEKLDQGFHYKNLDSDQIYDQELTNELMGYGENEGIVTGEMINMESSQFLVQDDTTYSWAPPDVELQEIINVEDDFEYDDHHHHHCDAKIMGLLPPHHTTTTSTSLCDLRSASDINEEEEETGGAEKDVELQEIVNLEDFEYADHHPLHDDTTMGLLPPPHTHTTTTTTSLCDLMTASDMNEEEEVGGANEDEDYGYTLEEWEHIFSTSPSSVVDNSTSSSSYMNQEVVQAHWPSQEFLKLLCS